MAQTHDTGRDHIYVGRIPGMWKWSTDYDLIREWAGGEENVSIMHKRGRDYVLDLSTDEAVIENSEVCMNRRYDCGHVAYGPPRRLPGDCPECKPVATDGGISGQAGEVACPVEGCGNEELDETPDDPDYNYFCHWCGNLFEPGEVGDD